MTKIEQLINEIKKRETKSAWSKGVTTYVLELLEQYTENFGKNASTPSEIDLLNGADSWNHYSWGGSSLIFDYDIAERLCTPSELKKTSHGDRSPNKNEEWLDVQARALFQAANRLRGAYKTVEARSKAN